MKKALIIICTAALLAALMAYPATAIARPTADQTPVGTLIIGTHLIYTQSMTSPLYELALQSAADSTLHSQQNSVYYKSEFAGGRWLDISSATNIYGLSGTAGKFVDNSVIDALTLKFYTPADGKTYDLSTGGQVAVSDILSPYDAKAQPEMEPLLNNLSAINEKRNGDDYDSDDDENQDVINTETSAWILNTILSGNYKDNYTNYLDSVVNALNGSLNRARDSGATVQKQEALAKLVSKYDHRRRAAALALMQEKIHNGLGEAAKRDLQGLISTMSPVAESLEAQIQAHLAEGGADAASGESSGDESSSGAADSGKEKLRSDLESQLTELLVEGGADSEADKLLQQLINMDNLDKGVVVSPDEELATALEMVDTLSGEFIEKLGGGAIDELAATSPDSPYEMLAAEQKQAGIFEDARLALQAAIEAAGERMSAQEYEAMLSAQMVIAAGMPAAVKKDMSEAKALESIQKHADWLGSEHRAAGDESAEKSEAQLLQIEINELEQKSKEALDKNDLALADNLDREIADKAARLDALEEDTAANIAAAKDSAEKLEEEAETALAIGDLPLAERLNAQLNSLREQINGLEASLPANTRAAQGEIARIKHEALEAVANGDVAAVAASAETIAAFAELEPVAALAAAEALSGAILRKEALFGAGGSNFSEAEQLLSGLLPGLQTKASEADSAGNPAATLSNAKKSLENLKREAGAAISNGNEALAKSLEDQIGAQEDGITSIEAALPEDIREARAEITQALINAFEGIAKGDKEALEANINNIAALADKEPFSALEAAEAIGGAISGGSSSGSFSEAEQLISELLPGLQNKASEADVKGNPAATIANVKQSIEDLKREAETAIENGDVKLSENIEYQISELEAEIPAMEATLPEAMQAIRSAIAQEEAKALEAIVTGDEQALVARVEAISALADKEPFSALEAVELIGDAIAAQELRSGTGGSLDEALELLSSLMPGLGEKAAAIGGTEPDMQKLRELCDTMLAPPPGDATARITAAMQLDSGKADKNLIAFAEEYYPLLPVGQNFTSVVTGGVRYVPAAVLPCYLNLRFLPEKDNICLLTNGALYYRFTRGGYEVKTHSGSLEMACPVYYSGSTAYLPESFVSEQFGLSILELPHRGTAVLVNKASAAKAAEVVAAMKGE